jgi:hypothetical protein
MREMRVWGIDGVIFNWGKPKFPEKKKKPVAGSLYHKSHTDFL